MHLDAKIREFAFEDYIAPARKREEHPVVIRAGDIYTALKLSGHMAMVCSVLESKLFREEYNVRLVYRRGPRNQANEVFSFEV